MRLPRVEANALSPARASRKPQRAPNLVDAVLALRTKPPCYGKDKTAVELRKDGWAVSALMAGRILADAKRRGIIRELPRPGVRRPNPRPKRPTPSESPKTTGLPAQATSSKSTRSTSARFPA